MIDRPTFSESWYRVADLRPRLRTAVQTYRQHFRGQLWYVVCDQSNNQYFRLNDSAYYLLGLLDGKKTVAQAWQQCNDKLGDAAPTQGEAIQLLGQLYSSNLLAAEIAGDAEGMFERYRKRVRREVGSYLMNIMSLRIPLFDPDHFLDRWVKLFGWVFSLPGLVLWFVLVGFGVHAVIGQWPSLFSAAQKILNPDPLNLALLYLSFAGIKAVHEMGHAFACKKFGKAGGTGGEVHTIGIMFLVLMPCPFVDASSAWAFKNKWHRAVVGVAGMYVELAVAAVAAMVWADTTHGNPTLHTIAYNVMFIASVSTLLFNANPLLRYDGYYILSDLLEIPNLAQRSKEYFYFLVKKFVYGVRNPRNPTNTPGEAFLMAAYGIASGVYRVFISYRILLFVADKLFIVGALMAVGAVVVWVIIPLGKFAHYLAVSDELSRTRWRAVGASLVMATAVALVVGIIPFPDRGRAMGIVEPKSQTLYMTSEGGFVDAFTPSGRQVSRAGAALVECHNRELESRLAQYLAAKQVAHARFQDAMQNDPAAAQIYASHLDDLEKEIKVVRDQLAALRVVAPFDGTWISPDIEHAVGNYYKRGDKIGTVADLNELHLRVVADQELGPRLESELKDRLTVDVRVLNRPDVRFAGSIQKAIPAGQERLPSPALGFAAGGWIQVDQQDRDATKATEPFFELQIGPAKGVDLNNLKTEAGDTVSLAAGQRVVVKFDLEPKPLVFQWYREIRQLIQRRFQV